MASQQLPTTFTGHSSPEPPARAYGHVVKFPPSWLLAGRLSMLGEEYTGGMPGTSNIVPESKTPDMYCLDVSNFDMPLPSVNEGAAGQNFRCTTVLIGVC